MDTNTYTQTLPGGRYVLEKTLGQGAMGVVYSARDRLSGAVVALKRVILDSEGTTKSLSDTFDLRMSLAREFKTLASLRHPHIISVHDYGFDEDRAPYFTMDYLESAPNILEAGRDCSLPERIVMVIQILQALAYLHRRGIIHRDIKPQNLLVVDKQVKMLDFGLATTRKILQTEKDNEFAGTLAYTSPEVLKGGSPTEASDLYSVGVVAYELIAGRHPFETSSVTQLIMDILNREPDLAVLELDDRLSAGLGRLLAKDPAARFQDAREPIAVYAEATNRSDLLRETDAVRESFLQAADFIGRDEEFGQLCAALSRAMEGQGSIWIVQGESGVGKSRLLDELRTHALVETAKVLRSQSVSQASAPYQVWRDILRLLCLETPPSGMEASVLKSIIPDIARLMGEDVPDAPELEGHAVQERLLQVVNSLFQQQRTPHVVILEDIHWAGDESLDLLRHLAQTIENLPLLVVASCRDDEGIDPSRLVPGNQLIQLERFARADIGQLAASMLGSSADRPDIVNLLQRETEGNVFFIVEVVRALAEKVGTLDSVKAMTLPHSIFPEGIKTVIQRRLDRVPEDARKLLEAAAIIGRIIDPLVMAALYPKADIADWLAACANAAVLEVVDDRWQFAHDKLREGIVNALPADHATELHRQVAEAVEKVHPDQAARLAFHWRQAGNSSKEAHYSALAGEQAIHSGTYADAITFFGRALELDKVSPAHTRARWERQLGTSHYALGHYGDSVEHLKRTLALLGYPLPSGSFATIMGILWQTGLQRLHRLLPALFTDRAKEPMRLREVGQALERLGEILYFRGAIVPTMYTGVRALNVVERAGPCGELARAYAGYGIFNSVLSLHKQAEDYLRRAREVAEEVGDPAASAWVRELDGVYAIGTAQWSRAEDSLRRAADLAEQIGQRRWWEENTAGLGLAAHFHDDVAKGIVYHQSTYQSAKLRGDGKATVFSLMGLVSGLLRRGQPGDLDTAIAYLEEALSIVRVESPGKTYELWMYSLFTQARMLEGAHPLAREAADQAVERIKAIGRPAAYYLVDGYTLPTQAYLALWEAESDPGERDALKKQAAICCKALHAYARTYAIGRPFAALWQGSYESLTGNKQKAHEWREKALAFAQQYSMIYDEAQIRYEIGRHLEPLDPARREHFDRAIELFTRLDAQFDLKRFQDAALKENSTREKQI